MTRYLDREPFSVGGSTKQYEAGWRATFGPAAKYEELLRRVVGLRAEGELTREQEFELAGEMDRYWNQMTDEEQEAMERLNSELR